MYELHRKYGYGNKIYECDVIYNGSYFRLRTCVGEILDKEYKTIEL